MNDRELSGNRWETGLGDPAIASIPTHVSNAGTPQASGDPNDSEPTDSRMGRTSRLSRVWNTARGTRLGVAAAAAALLLGGGAGGYAITQVAANDPGADSPGHSFNHAGANKPDASHKNGGISRNQPGLPIQPDDDSTDDSTDGSTENSRGEST